MNAPTNPAFVKPLDRTALIEQNRALVGFALNPLLRRWADLSDDDKVDVNAAGLRALVTAADNYDAGAGGKFSTYAVTCIQFAGRKAIASRGDWKARRAGVFIGSLDAPIELKDGSVTFGDLVADDRAAASFSELLDTEGDAARAAQLWAWIKATVTPRQFNALRLYYADGKSNAQTAEALGKSHQAASKRIQDGLAALKKASDTKSGRQMARRLFGAE